MATTIAKPPFLLAQRTRVINSCSKGSYDERGEMVITVWAVSGMMSVRWKRERRKMAGTYFDCEHT
jgi:hypothetical protein